MSEASNFQDPRVRRTHIAVMKAAGQLLADHGWDHVTHANVAKVAGYSKATLYKHWPTTSDLLHDAFRQIIRYEHAPVTGDLRADLVAELMTFHQVLTEGGLGNWLAAIADRASSDPSIARLRDQFLEDGRAHFVSLIRGGIQREELRPVPDVHAIADMLSGAVTYRVTLSGQSIDRDFIATVVDAFLMGAKPR